MNERLLEAARAVLASERDAGPFPDSNRPRVFVRRVALDDLREAVKLAEQDEPPFADEEPTAIAEAERGEPAEAFMRQRAAERIQDYDGHGWETMPLDRLADAVLALPLASEGACQPATDSGQVSSGGEDLGRWPCQDTLGGRPEFWNVDEDGNCTHPECHPSQRDDQSAATDEELAREVFDAWPLPHPDAVTHLASVMRQARAQERERAAKWHDQMADEAHAVGAYAAKAVHDYSGEHFRALDAEGGS